MERVEPRRAEGPLMQLWLIILNLTTSALVIAGLLLVVIALAGTRVGIGIRCRRCRPG